MNSSYICVSTYFGNPTFAFPPATITPKTLKKGMYCSWNYLVHVMTCGVDSCPAQAQPWKTAHDTTMYTPRPVPSPAILGTIPGPSDTSLNLTTSLSQYVNFQGTNFVPGWGYMTSLKYHLTCITWHEKQQCLHKLVIWSYHDT